MERWVGGKKRCGINKENLKPWEDWEIHPFTQYEANSQGPDWSRCFDPAQTDPGHGSFHLETRRIQAAGVSTVWSHVICWCWCSVFHQVKGQSSAEQEILEDFMLPADQLYGDDVSMFQQDVASAHPALWTIETCGARDRLASMLYCMAAIIHAKEAPTLYWALVWLLRLKNLSFFACLHLNISFSALPLG